MSSLLGSSDDLLVKHIGYDISIFVCCSIIYYIEQNDMFTVICGIIRQVKQMFAFVRKENTEQ